MLHICWTLMQRDFNWVKSMFEIAESIYLKIGGLFRIQSGFEYNKVQVAFLIWGKISLNLISFFLHDQIPLFFFENLANSVAD